MHQGVLSITIPVGYDGTDDETPLPAAFVGAEFGDTDPADITGDASENVAYCDIVIQAIDKADTVKGALLVAEAHKRIEELIRSAPVGESYYTHITNHRDFPPRKKGGAYFYTRVLSVRGFNLETH